MSNSKPPSSQTANSSNELPNNPPHTTKADKTYYALLGISPWASEIEIRRAYRDLSKLYHPDTTQLSKEVATENFQKINEA